MTRLLSAALVVVCLLSRGAAASAPVDLAVYIEDSHAGSFYWMVQNLPSHQDFELVLIDAHSDASEILDSDSIRRDILRAAGVNRLGSLVRQWRAAGAIQCYNWIEPLLPHPIRHVLWVPADTLTAAEVEQKRQQARQQIDCHEMAIPRQERDLSARYEVMDLRHFLRHRFTTPVVVSIDLDYFASEKSRAASQLKLTRILDSVLEMKSLQAVTISMSRQYLVSEEQSHFLLYLVLRYFTRVVNADIHFEPFIDAGEDRSQKAQDYHARQMDIPRYHVESAPACLKSLLVANASRMVVEHGREKWQRLLTMWKEDTRLPHVSLRPSGRTVPVDKPFRMVAEVRHVVGPTTQIAWKVLVPRYERYNLTGQSQGFADQAPRYLIYDEKPVDAADGRIELEGKSLLPFLDRKTAWGTLRVFCEVSDGAERYLSNVVCFSRSAGEGYRGALTEIFNLPYVYGSALLQVDGRTSADARYGADCAHFIIYGKRRQGINIPYVNPQGLLPYLRQIDEFTGFHDGVACGRHGPIRVTPDLLDKGMLLHFGQHVAAVFQDVHVLTASTQVVHQLETFPQVTTFGAMARKYKQIRVMTFR